MQHPVMTRMNCAVNFFIRLSFNSMLFVYSQCSSYIIFLLNALFVPLAWFSFVHTYSRTYMISQYFTISRSTVILILLKLLDLTEINYTPRPRSNTCTHTHTHVLFLVNNSHLLILCYISLLYVLTYLITIS